MSASPAAAGTKRRRVTQACDFCHRRGIKCKVTQPYHSQIAPASCLTCIEYGQECTRRRQPKVRGTKPRNSRTHTRLPQVYEGDIGVGSTRLGCGLTDVRLKDTDEDGRSVPVITDRKTVTALLDVYLDTIHPIFPFFCERDLWVGWRDGSFPASQPDYVSLVCMCALSAHHVGCGALFTDDDHLPAAAECASLSQEYLAEAIRTVPLDFGSTACVYLMRSYGLLALLGAQSNRRAMAHKYLGLYHGLCAHWNLHDEAQWPSGMDECETEVRRRLWWLMYRLEVHTACVFGSMVRCSEVYAAVDYPSGTHHPAFVPGRDGDFEDWFAGWNATTDLYRVLEHVIAEFRVRRRPRASILGGGGGGSASSAIADKLSRIQDEILPHFASAYSRSPSDSGRNRCGFQASHIICTIHLARIISTLGNGDFCSACQTADDMMATIATIPVEYIRAIGSPLLQQLAGVGHMLAGVAGKRQLPPEHRRQCKAVMASIIRFLSGLAGNNGTAAVEEKRLTARLVEAELDAASDVAGGSGFVGEDEGEGEGGGGGETLVSPDYNMEGFLADLNELVSTNMARSLTWPYEPSMNVLCQQGVELPKKAGNMEPTVESISMLE